MYRDRDPRWLLQTEKSPRSPEITTRGCDHCSQYIFNVSPRAVDLILDGRCIWAGESHAS